MFESELSKESISSLTIKKHESIHEHRRWHHQLGLLSPEV